MHTNIYVWVHNYVCDMYIIHLFSQAHETDAIIVIVPIL